VVVVVVAAAVAMEAPFTDATYFNNININHVNTKTSLNYTIFNDSLCTEQYTTSVCYKKQSIDAEKGSNCYSFWESYKIRTEKIGIFLIAKPGG
jgi:hypothetical protein